MLGPLRAHTQRTLRLPLYALPRALSIVALSAICGGLISWNGLLAHQMATKLHMNDFGKLYYSARAFLQARDMYGLTPATSMPVGEGQYHTFLNLNPPHFHIPLLPLALLPPELALALWGIASVVALVVSLRLIVGEVGLTLTPRRLLLGMIGVLGFAGTGAVAATGQVSFLLLLPITLAWIEARRGRWARAGAYLGLAASVKLFLLIFVPYLVLRRRFRAVAAAAGTAGLCFAVGLLLFGVDAHRSWLRALSSPDWAWAAMNGSILGLLTRTLSESPYYSPLLSAPGLITPIWLAAAGLAGMLTMVAAASRPTDPNVDRDFALLSLASQLISPLGWVYCLWLPVGPLAALIATWRRERESEGIRSVPFLARWRDRFLLLATPGLVWPLFGTTLFQPHRWATVVVGSVYFWATFALWLSLLVDWRLNVVRSHREQMPPLW